MKKRLSTFFLLPVLFLVSCSNNDDDPVIEQPLVVAKCRPVTSSRIANFNNQTDYLATHSYDASGRLIKIINAHGQSIDTVSLMYDQQGRLFKTYGTDVNEGYSLHQYNAAGYLKKIIEYNPESPWSNTLRATSEVVYDHNSAGQITTARYFDLVPSGGVPINPVTYSTFTYNAAGLIFIDSAYYEQNGMKVFRGKTVYLYDNKIGVSEFGAGPTSFHWPYTYATRKHNITSEITTLATGQVYTTIIQYQYNSQGYPLKAFMYDASGQLNFTSDITYNCF